MQHEQPISFLSKALKG